MIETVIVTGGEGFVGSELIKYLYDNTNLKIVSFDALLTGIRRERIKSSRVEYITVTPGNLGKTVENYLDRHVNFDENVTTIFHFGEYSRVVPSLKNVNTVIRSNVYDTNYIINLCRIYRLKLIYSASSTRFDTQSEVNQELINKTPYSYFKSQAVETIKNFGKWFGLNYNIAYFYNVYGDNQVEIGEYATVIGIWLHQHRTGHPITIIGDGTQTRDFTHIDDIINGLYLIYLNGKFSHEYHLGTGKDYSINQVAKLFVDKGDKLEYKEYIDCERKGGRAPLDNLAKDELGWESKHNILDYIKSKLN